MLVVVLLCRLSLLLLVDCCLLWMSELMFMRVVIVAACWLLLLGSGSCRRSCCYVCWLACFSLQLLLVVAAHIVGRCPSLLVAVCSCWSLLVVAIVSPVSGYRWVLLVVGCWVLVALVAVAAVGCCWLWVVDCCWLLSLSIFLLLVDGSCRLLLRVVLACCC